MANNEKSTTSQFIEKALKVHGNRYDYTNSEYITAEHKISISCKEHGDFMQSTRNHLNGKGCPKCGLIKNGNSTRLRAENRKMDVSNIEVPENSIAIPLNEKQYCLIDSEDYDLVHNYTWHVIKTPHGFYASTNTPETRKRLSMHRLVMGVVEKDVEVDHIYHNTLDNRKSQLRKCTQAQNQMNRRSLPGSSSQYKGVCWDKARNKWSSQIVLKKKNTFLGYYDNEVTAAKAYDLKAKELFGEFAYLNFKS